MSSRKRHQRLLDESLGWLRGHPHATNQDVPAHLLREWVVDTRGDDPTSSLSLTVFLFGYCQAQLMPDQSRRLEISASEVAEKFQYWQMKLGLAELHHKTDLQSAAMPLFSFPTGEQVSFWKSAPTNTASARHPAV